MRILVVDDEQLIREWLKDLLTQLGHEPFLAQDGVEALQAVHAEHPELIISDINMPNLDGISLLDELRKQEAPPPVILITGYADIHSAIQALRHGAEDYIFKPVNIDELTRRIEQVERLRELERVAAEARRKAALASRLAAVGQLAAGVAHEINNPTTYVRGSAQVLEKMRQRLQEALDQGDADKIRLGAEMLAQEMEASLASIDRGTDRIRQITRGLTYFGEGYVAEEQGDWALRTCAEEALSLLEPPDGEIQVERQFEKDLPAIRINRRAIIQSVMCLLMNAFQAVREREDKRIRVSIFADGENQCIRVEDSGPGVPKEEREQIFDPFYTTREVGQGAGLGLSMVFGIVTNDHGGHIGLCESRMGGACFCITLPANREAAEDADERLGAAAGSVSE